MTRVGAVQIWPEWNDQVLPMPATAPLTSPSSNTTAAPLPPSSSSSRFMPRPAVSAIFFPAGGLGVLLPDRRAAGERHHVYVGLDERLSGLRAGTGDDVEDARWKTRL